MKTIWVKKGIRLFAILMTGAFLMSSGFNMQVPTAFAATDFYVSSYGAVGDGVTDDGPAIEQTIEAAVAASGAKNVVFDANKTYRIGNKADNWRYFQIIGAADLVLQGNGSTLLFTPGNYPFNIQNSSNVTLQNLTIDYSTLTITQGKVVALDASTYSFDVLVDAGYPDPPTDAFVLSNRGSYPGTGGNHGLLYEATSFERKDSPIDHFKIKSITDQGSGIYRFVLADSYQSNMGSIGLDDRFVYNFQNLTLTTDEANAKGQWIKDYQTNDYNGSILYTPAVDNSASASFSGTSISYVARKGPDMGMADVYVDGNKVASNIDLYSSTPQYQSTVYTNTALSNANHTIKIKATGTKNPSSTGTKMSVDYFQTATGKIDSDTLSLTSYTIAAASILISGSSNVTLQDINSYFSPGMFARVYNNSGDVTIRRVDVRVKPGSDRLLGNGSDVIHAKNNRGAVVIDSCYFEAANDDLVNISSMALNVSNLSGTQMVLKSTDNFYFDYDIRVNDTIKFTDFANNKVLGDALVTAVTRLDYGTYQVTLNQAISGIVPGSTTAWDMNQTNPNSVVENSTFRPVLRHSLFTRMNGGTIANNTIQGIGGYGISLSDEGVEGVLANGVTISGNSFDKVKSFGILFSSGLANYYNLHDANLTIENNTMTNQSGNGISLSNLRNVTMLQNAISMDSTLAPSTSRAVILNNMRNVDMSGMSITDMRSGIGSAVSCTYCENSTVNLNYDKLQIANGVSPYQLTEKLDDTSTDVAYSVNNWTTVNDASDYNGSMQYSPSSADQASFTFDGTSVQFGAKKGPGAGIANVSLAGNTTAVDLYQASAAYQAVVYQNNSLNYGRHTLAIQPTGTKNTASTGAAVNLDFIQYGTQIVRKDHTDASVTYTGTWSSQSTSSDYGGAMKYTAALNASAQFTFTGTSFAYGARKGPGAGIATVEVDGTPHTVDLYAPSADYQSVVYQEDGLSYGPHTVVVKYTNTKNAASTGTAVNVDFFDYR